MKLDIDLTPAEIRKEGWEALVSKLGVAKSLRFLLEYDKGHGDYTVLRREIFSGQTLGKILEEMAAEGVVPEESLQPGVPSGSERPVFDLTLHPTYYGRGFFNITGGFDRFVRREAGSVKLRLGRNGPEIPGRIDRKANKNGTARIHGGAKLRDWFQKNFELRDVVSVDLGSSEIIVFDKRADA